MLGHLCILENRVLGPTCHTLQDLAVLLTQNEWPRFNTCKEGNSFYDSIVQVDDISAVILANPAFVSKVRRCHHMFLDGTFKAARRFNQSLTVFATTMDHARQFTDVADADKRNTILINCRHFLYFIYLWSDVL